MKVTAHSVIPVAAALVALSHGVFVKEDWLKGDESKTVTESDAEKLFNTIREIWRPKANADGSLDDAPPLYLSTQTCSPLDGEGNVDVTKTGQGLEMYPFRIFKDGNFLEGTKCQVDVFGFFNERMGNPLKTEWSGRAYSAVDEKPSCSGGGGRRLQEGEATEDTLESASFDYCDHALKQMFIEVDVKNAAIFCYDFDYSGDGLTPLYGLDCDSEIEENTARYWEVNLESLPENYATVSGKFTLSQTIRVDRDEADNDSAVPFGYFDDTIVSDIGFEIARQYCPWQITLDRVEFTTEKLDIAGASCKAGAVDDKRACVKKAEHFTAGVCDAHYDVFCTRFFGNAYPSAIANEVQIEECKAEKKGLFNFDFEGLKLEDGLKLDMPKFDGMKFDDLKIDSVFKGFDFDMKDTDKKTTTTTTTTTTQGGQ